MKRPDLLLAVCASVVSLSAEALSRHRLRTLLGVTGIVIGIGAVTAMASVVEGARREVTGDFDLLGLNNVVFRPRYVAGSNSKRVPRISFDDLDQLRVLAPFIPAWSPVLERSFNIGGPIRSADVNVLGVAPDFNRIMRLAPAEGRLLTVLDSDRASRVCVLGVSVSKSLFGESVATGKAVLIGGAPYAVVGVLQRRGSPGSSGGALAPRDLNAAVLVPARHGDLFGQAFSFNELWAQVPDSIPVAEGGAVASHALQQLHSGQTDVDLLVPLELLQQRLRAQRTFGVVLGSVAVLALLVGGIGIMNMMLASVLERTSEIGLRRSVGATRRWIMWQFLAESVMMTLTGGAIGVVAGVGVSLAVTRYAGWATYVSIPAVGLALIVSAAVGIFFGTYPARRAADLAPIEALRYE